MYFFLFSHFMTALSAVAFVCPIPGSQVGALVSQLLSIRTYACIALSGHVIPADTYPSAISR